MTNFLHFLSKSNSIFLMLLSSQILKSVIIQACPYQNTEQSILPIEYPFESQRMYIPFYDLKSFDSIGFGFWSLSQPLFEPKSYPQVDQEYVESLQQDGQLLMTVYANTYMMLLFASFDQKQLQVNHKLLLFDSFSFNEMQFSFSALEYEAQWLFTFITLQYTKDKKIRVIYEMSQQKYQSKFLDIHENSDQYLLLGGRGHMIGWFNLNIYTGYLTKLYQKQYFFWNENMFQELANYCSIPQLPLVNTFLPTEGLINYDGTFITQNSVRQNGKNYCLSGWMKIDLSEIIETTTFTLIRITVFKDYHDSQNDGDQIFIIKVLCDIENEKNTEIIIMADMHNIPIKGVMGQYSQKNYKIISDKNSNYIFTGLQQWFFIQYEYGRKYDHKFGFFSIQFFNQAGLIQCDIGDSMYGGSGDDYNLNYMIAQTYNLQFQFNYDIDKENLYYECHYSCKTCNGPLQNNCLSCKENENRYFQQDQKTCICKSEMIEQSSICIDFSNFYPEVIRILEEYDQQQCPYGHFQVPKKDGFICLQCPYQSEHYLYCAECYLNPLTWYLFPQCVTDLITVEKNTDFALNSQKREFNDFDLFIIDEYDNLLLKSGWMNILEPKLGESTQITHLGNTISITCKTNFLYNNGDCIFFQLNCINAFQNKCIYCIQGMYLKNDICIPCDNHCILCNQLNSGNCYQCEKDYQLIDNQCVKCGINCKFCGPYYDQNLQKTILKCFQCADDSKYFLSFDGVNCLQNDIENCEYAFQSLKSDIKQNTLDFYFLPRTDFSEIEIHCARCNTNYIYIYESKICLERTYFSCQYGYAQKFIDYDPKSSVIYSVTDEKYSYSTTEQFCLVNWYFDQSVLQFSQYCTSLISFCNVCIIKKNHQQWDCISCIQGYYSERITGKCRPCPLELHCKQCYQQQTLFQDHWKQKIRAFYKQFIDSNNDHPFIEFGQSQNSNDYQIKCKKCKDGYDLYENICIESCPQNCAECQIIDQKNICVRCFKTEKGVPLTLINNQCMSCPENCALCSVRQPEEIIAINPLFNTTDDDLKKYSHQCLKSYKDKDYFYDSLIKNFIHCKDSTKGCQNQYEININLYCNMDEFLQDLYSIPVEQQYQFLRKNIIIIQLTSASTFPEYETFNFYKMANMESIRAIHLIITSSKQQTCQILKESFFNQIFSQQIFSAIDIALTINCTQKTIFQIFQTLSFNNFTSVTLNGLTIESIPNSQIKEISFNSVFQQKIQIYNCQMIQSSKQTDMMKIVFNRAKHIEIQNFTFDQSNNKDTIFLISNTDYPKTIKLINFNFANSIFKNSSIFSINIGDQDQIFIQNFTISSIFTDTQMIQSIADSALGSISIENFTILNSKITDSFNFIDLKGFTFARINILYISNSIVVNSKLLLLGHQINLQQFILQNCELTQENIIIYNNLDEFVQEDYRFMFENIKFNQNLYSVNTKFVLLSKNVNYQSFLELTNLEISTNRINDAIVNYNPQSINNSMINIQIDNSILTNAVIKRGFGINDISVFNAKKLVISNFLIKQDESFRFLILHNSLDCLYKNIPGELFTTSIHIFSVENLILLDIYISNIISINCPLIYYKSEDQVKSITQENFLIQNITINSNFLLLTKLQKKVSLILVDSSQAINMKFLQLSINSNILQEYDQDSSFESALTINLNVPIGQVIISDSTFQQNQIFNTSSSLMLIKSSKLTIKNSLFQNNNLFSYELIRNYMIWSLDQTNEIFIEDIKTYLQIKSISGNGKFDVEAFEFVNSSINYSSGQIGAGFHIIANKHCIIKFNEIHVDSIQTYFQSNEEYGGAFYIDSNFAQQLNVQIYNIIATNILSRNKGGLMFFKIGAINSKIIIHNITASNVYSLSGSLIYIEFQKNNDEEQLVTLNKINYNSDYLGWKAYLSLYFDYTIDEKRYLLYRSVIQVQSAVQIQLQNSYFNHLIYESSITFNNINDVKLTQIVVINSLLLNKLIYILPSQYNEFNLVLKGLYATNVSFGMQQSQSDDACLRVQQQYNQTNEWFCSTQQNKAPTHLSFKSLSTDEKLAICLIQQMIVNLDMSVSGLILIDSLSSKNNLMLKSINLFDIQCSKCNFGLIWIQTSSINFSIQTISDLKILNSSCGLKGCLVIQNNLVTSRILNSNEQIIGNQSQTLLIQNYICQQNSATNGTCIYLDSIKTILTNNIFLNNTASLAGGAIYIKNIQNVLIIKSIIENNTAAQGGGIYLKDKQQIHYQKLSTLIYQNQAKEFQDEIATVPSKLNISLGFQDNLPVLTDIESTSEQLIETISLAQTTILYGFESNSILLPNGQKISDYQIFNWKSQSYQNLNLKLRLKAYDINNIQVKGLTGSFCEINHRILNIQNPQDSNFSESYQIIFNETTQDYNLDDQIFYFDSDSPQNLYLQIQFHCNNIQVPTYNKNYPFEILSTHNNYFLRLNVRSFPCQLGEIKNTTLDSCQTCDSQLGLYSLQLNQTKCQIKDEISTLSVTPVMLQIRTGYWRPIFYSTTISECYNSQQNCLGGWIAGDSSCYEGHIGALCEQCDIYDTKGMGNYAINQKFSCGSCVDKWKNFTLIIFISIWTILSITISVQGTIKNLEQKAKKSSLRLINLNTITRTVCSAILIKMLTNYFQIISSATTFRIDMSSTFQSIIQAAGSPIQPLIYSLDCFLVNIFNFEILYSKMIWQLIMPIIYLNIFFILYVVALKLKSLEFNKSAITTSIIYLYIYFQPTLIGELIGLISYRDISDILWVQSNVSYQYNTNTHISWMLKFCLPIIIILAILVPIYLFFVLVKNKQTFQEKNTKLIWGYLYIEYKEIAFFWEILKIVQKELIIVALTFYDDYIVLKAMIMIFILLVYLNFNKWFEPYKNIRLNQLDHLTTYICIITFSLAIGAFISQQQNFEQVKLIFIVVILTFNIYLLIIFIRTIISEIIFETNEKYEKQLDEIRLYFRRKFPIINKIECIKIYFQSQQEKRNRVYQNFKKLKDFAMPKAKEIIKLKNQSSLQNSKSLQPTFTNMKSFDNILNKNEKTSKTPQQQLSASIVLREQQLTERFPLNQDPFPNIRQIKEESFQDI